MKQDLIKDLTITGLLVAIIILFLLILAPSVRSDNHTNCSRVDLNISLVPSETKTGNISFCYYDVNCSGCGNATTSKCVIEKDLDAGDSYDLETDSCDLDITCRYDKKECLDNETREVDVWINRFKKENRSYIKIEVGDEAEEFPIDLDDFSYMFPISLKCPGFEEENLNVSWAYEKCRDYLPRLMDDDQRWGFYSTSFETWSNKLGDVSTSTTECNILLTKCLTEKEKMVNKSLTVDLKVHEDLEEKYETMRITSVIKTIVLWIETPMLIALMIFMFVIEIRRGAD